MNTGRVWYVPGEGRHPSGPFSEEEILEGLRTDWLNETTLCWREGMDQWLALGQVEPFAAKISAGTFEAVTSDPLCREEARPALLECPNCHQSVTAEQSSESPGELQCPSCGSTVTIFEQNTLVSDGQSAVESPRDEVDLQIEGYQILGGPRIGGMGMVWEAL
ncbi:MAG: GYF domain-containing protein, partial [Planctomycetota bacterium]